LPSASQKNNRLLKGSFGLCFRSCLKTRQPHHPGIHALPNRRIPASHTKGIAGSRGAFRLSSARVRPNERSMILRSNSAFPEG
jgi:hypothetical protein